MCNSRDLSVEFTSLYLGASLALDCHLSRRAKAELPFDQLLALRFLFCSGAKKS